MCIMLIGHRAWKPSQGNFHTQIAYIRFRLAGDIRHPLRSSSHRVLAIYLPRRARVFAVCVNVSPALYQQYTMGYNMFSRKHVRTNSASNMLWLIRIGGVLPGQFISILIMF